MKYISIDIETSGLSPENNQILSIGAIIEDTELKLPYEQVPKFYCLVEQHTIHGSIFALNLNSEIIKELGDYQAGKSIPSKVYDPWQVVKKLQDFITENNGFVKGKGGDKFYINVAGKNFHNFDLKFLEQLPRWSETFEVARRSIDPSIFFTDWKEDKEIPNLEKCKERAGFNSHVSHNALEDAWDVVELLRKQY